MNEVESKGFIGVTSGFKTPFPFIPLALTRKFLTETNPYTPMVSKTRFAVLIVHIKQ